jgi:hypothetical protein
VTWITARRNPRGVRAGAEAAAVAVAIFGDAWLALWLPRTEAAELGQSGVRRSRLLSIPELSLRWGD